MYILITEIKPHKTLNHKFKFNKLKCQLIQLNLNQSYKNLKRKFLKLSQSLLQNLNLYPNQYLSQNPPKQTLNLVNQMLNMVSAGQTKMKSN